MGEQLTMLLDRARKGSDTAVEEFLVSVYHELRTTARRVMGGERPDFSMAATDLVHEAYFRLFRNEVDWDNRRHFFGSAASAMRRVLIDHARRKQAGKRIPQRELVSIELAHEPAEMPEVDLLALDQALDRLAEEHPRQAKIVELRFFAGLSESEIAEILGVSRMTVSRDWKVARLRLRRDMRS